MFKINGAATVNLKLVDNLKTPISFPIFANVIKSFASSGSFYINLNYDAHTQCTWPIVTPEVS